MVVHPAIAAFAQVLADGHRAHTPRFSGRPPWIDVPHAAWGKEMLVS